MSQRWQAIVAVLLVTYLQLLAVSCEKGSSKNAHSHSEEPAGSQRPIQADETKSAAAPAASTVRAEPESTCTSVHDGMCKDNSAQADGSNGASHHYGEHPPMLQEREDADPLDPTAPPEPLPKETADLKEFSSSIGLDMAQADGLDAPIQLVRPNPNGHEQLEIVEEGLRRLASVPSPLALVAVVGKFHTGKSFLLNQVMRKQSGFGVGRTVQPETMGIWMWGKPLTMTLDTGSNISVVFLDTEGFAASNISESYDAKVFAVASLLSSYLIYNSVKIIDQSDIDYLELLARRTQLFALQSQLNAEKFALEFNHNLLKFPPLLWVVQDFVQAGLGGPNGESAQTWLKKLMKTSTREQEKHEISLLDIFETVDCHTLFLPAVRKRLLQDLSLAQEEELTEEYRSERDDLIEKLRSGLVPKERNGVAINGAEISLLVKLLVSAANEGSLAEVPGRWGAFTQHLTQTAFVECLKFFDAEAERQQEDGAMGDRELQTWYNETAGRTLTLMERLLIGLGSSFAQASGKIRKSLGRRHHTILELNARRVEILCQQTQQTVDVNMFQEAGKIVLPLPSSQLEQQLQELVDKHSLNFEQALVQVNDTDTFLLYNTSTQKVLASSSGKFLAKNRQHLESLLDNAKEESLNIYTESIRAELVHALSTARLSALQAAEGEKAKEHFAAVTSMARPEKYYDVYKSAFVLALKTVMEEDQATNNEVVRRLCEEKVSALLETLQERVNSRRIALPANESDIRSQFKTSEEVLLNQYVNMLEQYSDMESFRSSLDNFKVKSVGVLEALLKENLDAYTREVEVPLETAVKIVMMSADKYDTAFSFHQYVDAVCLVHLDSGKAKVWGGDLKKQIVANFVSNHMYLQQEFQKRTGLWADMKGFAQWLLWFLFGL